MLQGNVMFMIDCMNSQRQCICNWDEGEKFCIHVLSNETAAGDEIGWKLVNAVFLHKQVFRLSVKRNLKTTE